MDISIALHSFTTVHSTTTKKKEKVAHQQDIMGWGICFGDGFWHYLCVKVLVWKVKMYRFETTVLCQSDRVGDGCVWLGVGVVLGQSWGKGRWGYWGSRCPYSVNGFSWVSRWRQLMHSRCVCGGGCGCVQMGWNEQTSLTTCFCSPSSWPFFSSHTVKNKNKPLRG